MTTVELKTQNLPPTSAIPRVRFIQIDQGKGKYLHNTLLLCSLAGGLAAVVLLIAWIGEDGLDIFDRGSFWVVIAGFLLAIGLMIGFGILICGPFFLVQHWLGNRLLPEQAARIRRLDLLVDRPEAQGRFLHRKLEHALRTQKARSSNGSGEVFLIGVPPIEVLKKFTPELPPGQVIVVYRQRHRFSRRIQRIETVFEPVRFADAESILDSAASGACDATDRSDARGERHNLIRRTSHRWRRIQRQLSPLFSWLVVIGFVAFLVFLVNFPRTSTQAVPVVAMMVGGMALALFVSRARGGSRHWSWWLVPGALMFRNNQLLRHRTSVGLIDRSSAFVIIEAGMRIHIYEGEKEHELRCTGRQADAFLAAWLSPARTPTKEEVLAFFGPDAEWAQA
jgi:FtsH-binding integral membrane protein